MEPEQIQDLSSQITRLRQQLESEGFEESREWNDAYIGNVISVPGRTFEKAYEKLKTAIQWGRDFKISELSPDKFQEQLNKNSMYWYGRDNKGNPILWVIYCRKDFRHLDVEKEIQMNVWLAETALKNMPEGCEKFTLINDTGNIGLNDFSIGMMRGLLNALENRYPDRLHRFYAGPTNYVVSLVYKMLQPFLPTRLTEKIILMRDVKEIKDILYEKDVPDFFGGPCKHPNFLESPDDDLSSLPESNKTKKSSSKRKSKDCEKVFRWEDMIELMKINNQIKDW